MNDAPLNAAIFKGEAAAELLPVSMIEPWEHNPRRTRDSAKLCELAESIAKAGVLQPILVRPVRDGAMFSIVVEQLRMLSGRKDDANAPTPSASANGGAPARAPSKFDDLEDDIPF